MHGFTSNCMRALGLISFPPFQVCYVYVERMPLFVDVVADSRPISRVVDLMSAAASKDACMKHKVIAAVKPFEKLRISTRKHTFTDDGNYVVRL